MPFWMGDDDRAAVALRPSRSSSARRLVDAPLISQALGGLARVALRTDVPEGRRLAHEALDVSEAAGDEPGRSNALHLLGVGAQIAGDLLEARDWMTAAAGARPSARQRLPRRLGGGNLSMVERQLGNLDAAEALEREALESAGASATSSRSRSRSAGLAAIATDRGDIERAATLLGAAEAIMEAQHMAWPPDERPHYERMLADLPEAMGVAEFERVRSAGKSMSAADAVALALTDA